MHFPSYCRFDLKLLPQYCEHTDPEVLQISVPVSVHDDQRWQLTCKSSCITLSTAGPTRLPGVDRVSLTATFSAPSRAYAMLTIIAVFRLMSLWRFPAERNEVICSSMLSWIFGVCRGRHIAKSCSAEFTTSVAGGSGRSNGPCDLPTYRDIESCSRAPQIGDSSCTVRFERR